MPFSRLGPFPSGVISIRTGMGRRGGLQETGERGVWSELERGSYICGAAPSHQPSGRQVTRLHRVSKVFTIRVTTRYPRGITVIVLTPRLAP